ncbi:hypothetical protein KCV07_g76, partial [Aureobasidium melanogenum]
MCAPGSGLFIVVLANDKDDSTDDDEDPSNPSKNDRSDDTGAVSVVQRSLAVLHDQSISLSCADTGNIGVLRSNNDSHGNTAGKVHKDTRNGTDLPSDSDTMVLTSLRPDQVEEESATKDGSHVNSSEDVRRFRETLRRRKRSWRAAEEDGSQQGGWKGPKEYETEEERVVECGRTASLRARPAVPHVRTRPALSRNAMPILLCFDQQFFLAAVNSSSHQAPLTQRSQTDRFRLIPQTLPHPMPCQTQPRAVKKKAFCE